jgi:hypothetical protein
MAIRLVELDLIGLRADANRFSTPAVRTATRQILNRSAILCPVDTGRLRASGKMSFREAKRGPTGVVVYAVKYALAVHDGTGPYIIMPKKRKVLKFKVGGKTVFAKRVRHPGVRARPFLRLAAEEIAGADGYRFVRSNSDATPVLWLGWR